jgi:hypothetical protein
MSNSRRDFLKRGAVVAVAAGVPLSLTDRASALGLTATKDKKSDLSLEAFQSQLNSSFLIHNEGSKVEVKLVNVTNHASRTQTLKGKEGFSLIFQGSQESPLEQKTFVIEHKKLGLFSFLLVPVNLKNKSIQHYEAVVNRLYP